VGELLGMDPEVVDVHTPFNDYGLASVDAVGLSGELAEMVDRPLSPTIIYDYPTIARLARYLAEPEAHGRGEREHTAFAAETAIAIIGMACRFPGQASTPDAFWQLLSQGQHATTDIPPQRWQSEAYYDPSPETPGKMYTRAGCFLDDVAGFDANFFGISPREATRMDPQQRLLIEVTWEAIENAGLAMSALAGSPTGVFIGMMNTHEYSQLQMQQQEAAYRDDPHAGTGSASSVASGRLAYLFDWQGPTLTVDTACSSSLVSLHLACQSLRKGECTVAVVGGVNTVLLPETMVNACKMGMLAPDGHCKTFDAGADGFGLGEGCAVVVLKPLAEALADKNPLLAIIRGSAVNQDGRSNGMTAPNKLAQVAVIRQALARAGVNPWDIDYVEAHGSGTSLGDPIEIAALEAVFAEGRSAEQPLQVGAVKTNIGHLVGAAGIAGLIKTVLALQHKEIPPHLNLKQINPHIARLQHVTAIPTVCTPWLPGRPARLAGVSSFGWSGTNAHVILQEAPEPETLPAPAAPAPTHLLVLSAHTETALNQATDNLATYIQEHPDVPLAAIARTLQSARSPLQYRRMLVCRDRDDALALLRTQSAQRVVTGLSPVERPVAFLFPGVGEHYVDLALELYQVEATFRETVVTCCALLKEKAGLDLHDAIFSQGARNAPSSNGKGTAFPRREGVDLRRLMEPRTHTVLASLDHLKQTVMAQPAAFVIEYALARLLEKWGIRPGAMLGYSLGEYVAACLAGVFSLEDALLLVAGRAKMIQSMPAGAMVAVFLSEQAVQPYLTHTICLAAVNGPATCVLAGPLADIERLEARLTSREVAHRRLETTHAFHSRMLDPLRTRLTRLIEGIELHAPRIPYLSNVTGNWITAEQATSPQYWAEHMCQTVRFASGISALLQASGTLLLEVGPGQALSSFARQHSLCTRERTGLIFSTLPTVFERLSDYACVLTAVGKMWVAGARVDWPALAAGTHLRPVPLPNYPFEHQRYWIEGQARAQPQTSREGQGKRPLADWFSIPTWRQKELSGSQVHARAAVTCWLFLLDTCAPGQRLVEQLLACGQEVITVTRGTSFTNCGDGQYILRPGERADYEALLHELQVAGKLPRQIVHLWTTTPEEVAGDGAATIEVGFESLIALTQALGNLDLPACQITLISTELHNVAGDEQVCPEKALLLGPCRVIPQEYPALHCRSIDIPRCAPASRQEEVLLRQLVRELSAGPADPVVALRRWVQAMEPVALDEPTKACPPLREGGVYLITGGLGGIGLAIAGHLAQSVGARLVLVGRTALAARDTWEQVQSEATDPARSQARAIRAIEDMEALGARVLVLQADVANEAQMRQVIAQTVATFGTLHGVFHAAGIPGMGLLQLKTRAQTASVLAPKVQGTQVLQRVLADRQIDFLVLCSSLTSLTGGGPGQSDYAAASAFLDAWAQRHAYEQGMTIAIDWGEWQWNAWETGLAGYDAHTQAFLREHRQRFGIAFAEGMEALMRMLVAGFPQVVVSPQDIQAVIELSAAYTTAGLPQQSSARPLLHTRPELATSYIAARTETERRIAALWGEHLGIEHVGINDNFFELGGNSLIGMEMIRQTRRAFALTDLPPYMLYEAPTVRLIAQYLEQRHTVVPSVEKTQERSEKRRERRKQRAQEIRKESQEQ
jgi:acyl transferase domain-containing protein/acyl carrier protein